MNTQLFRSRLGIPSPAPIVSLHGQTLAVWLFVVFAISLGLFVFGMLEATQGEILMLLGAAVLSLLITCWPILRSRRFFLFEPLSFVIFSVLMGLTLKTLYVVYGLNTNSPVVNTLVAGLDATDLRDGALVLMTGLFFFSWAYSLRIRPLPLHALRRYRASRSKVLFYSVIFIGFSALCFALFVAMVGVNVHSMADLSQKRFQGGGTTSASRLESASYYLYRLSLVSKAPMYVLFYSILKHRLRWLSVYGLMFGVAFLINMSVPFFISNKAGIILPVADLMIIAYVLRRRLNWLKAGGIVFGALLVIFMISKFRGGASVAGIPLLDEVFRGRYFIGLTKSAQIIAAFPEYLDYFYGLTFIGWLNLLLPASMEFDNSTFAGLGFYLGFHVFNLAQSGVPPGIVPEFYINFGVAGVVVGMFLLGFLLKWMHVSLFQHLGNPAGLLLYAIVAVRLPTFLFNNGFSVALLKTAADVIIVVVFLVLIRSRSASRRAR